MMPPPLALVYPLPPALDSSFDLTSPHRPHLLTRVPIPRLPAAHHHNSDPPFGGETFDELVSNVLCLNYCLPDALSVDVRRVIDGILQVLLPPPHTSHPLFLPPAHTDTYR